MTETSSFDETLKKLSDQVSQFTEQPVATKSSGISFSFNSPIMYLTIPIGVAILLFFWKPDFITEEVSEDGKFPTKKTSFKKVIIASLVITTILVVAYFAYNYKKKKPPDA